MEHELSTVTVIDSGPSKSVAWSGPFHVHEGTIMLSAIFHEFPDILETDIGPHTVEISKNPPLSCTVSEDDQVQTEHVLDIVSLLAARLLSYA